MTPRFHFAADTISIALVIWLVFLVEVIRDFISRKDAISVLTTLFSKIVQVIVQIQAGRPWQKGGTAEFSRPGCA